MNENMQSKPQNPIDIDFPAIFKMLFVRSWIIILAFLLVFVGVYFTKEKNKQPMYHATAKMYVTLYSPENATTGGYYSSSSQFVAQQLIALCGQFVNTNLVMEDVMSLLDREDGVSDGVYTSPASGTVYTAGMIKGMVSISSANETEIMMIRVISSNSEDSIAIANAIIRILPGTISNIVKTGYANKIDDAYYSGASNLPSISGAMKYGILAAFLVALVFVVIQLFDTRIRTKEEIERRYNIPVLGDIPNFGSAGRRGERYYHYYGNKKNAEKK